jgi:hypothetical protein
MTSQEAYQAYAAAGGTIQKCPDGPPLGISLYWEFSDPSILTARDGSRWIEACPAHE